MTTAIGDEPFVLVLDEFPYLASAVPALTSILQHYWDHAWARTRLTLVLCDSYITSMRQMDELDQPLYGRRTGRISFSPFTAANVSAFTPRWSARERMQLYGLVGQLPGHLALVDPGLSLEDNAAEVLLDPSGRLVDEAQHMLDAFLPDAAVHYSIVEAIATGDRTWSGITRRVGRTGGALSRPVQWLEEMQITRRVVPLTVRDPARSKRAVYEIIDPYVAFWHREIAPLVRAGSIGLAEPHQLWTDIIEPRLSDHMGLVFEQVCREWVATWSGRSRPLRLGRWWSTRSEEEVDVVALSTEGDLIVGECKWGSVSRGDFEALRGRARLIEQELGHAGPTRHLLFTGSGQADDGVQELASKGRLELIGPEDLVGSDATAPSQ